MGGELLQRIMTRAALEALAGGQDIVPEAHSIVVLRIKGQPRYLRVRALRLNPLTYQRGFAGARRGKYKGQPALVAFLHACKQALARNEQRRQTRRAQFGQQERGLPRQFRATGRRNRSLPLWLCRGAEIEPG